MQKLERTFQVKTLIASFDINKSLTSFRKRLFGRIHNLKKENQFKFIWTVNGKILLRETAMDSNHMRSSINSH